MLRRVDAGTFASLIGAWLSEQEVGALLQLAADGKSLQSLSAVTHHLRLTLDPVPTAAIRGDWAVTVMENGTHHRRHVTLGEDANRTADRHRAVVLASLRNLANGHYELERERERTKVDMLRSWCQQQTCTSAWPLLPC